MSFTSEVKDELVRNLQNARHCRIAELAAIACFIGSCDRQKKIFSFSSENKNVVEKSEKIIKKIFPVDNIERIFYDRRRAGKDIFVLELKDTGSQKLMETLKLSPDEENNLTVAKGVYMSDCCKRAFLRGAFLTAGSLTDPQKDYHMEFACPNMILASTVVEIIAGLGIEARTVERKKQKVVYVKDSDDIVDLLGFIGAHVALMDMENVRILKDMRNNINRRVNCETSNIRKTTIASARQVADINYIEQTIGLEELGEGLSETARLRVMYPEASLVELGNLHAAKVGKSGVNHRLARISEIADKLRNTNGGKNDY